MGDLIFDFGNFEGKWYSPTSRRQGNFMHALARLSDSEWTRIVGRGKPAKGLVKVNGIPFAIGMAARRHTIQDRPAGAARYTDEYYGAALAYALTEAFDETDLQVTLVASYPPVDLKYAKRLADAARRDWNIECSAGAVRFGVTEVIPFDEPIGGYSNVVLNKNGTERRSNRFANQTALVVDVGGYTVDVVPVDPDGQIDYLGAKSTRTGTLNVMRDFEEELRTRYAEEFREAGDLDPRRVERAVRSGRYPYGKSDLECDDLAIAAINQLVNDVRQVIMSAGGIANYDAIILTGGGSALIYDALCEAVPQIEFSLAETNIEMMRFANVYGGAKLLALDRLVNGGR